VATKIAVLWNLLNTKDISSLGLPIEGMMYSKRCFAEEYWVFRAQADWAFILPSELPTKELRHLPRKMPQQAYQTSMNVVSRGGINGRYYSYTL
jgi:hypothetical protein